MDGAFADWTGATGLELYPHQMEALIELLSGANVILATPTGSGPAGFAGAQLLFQPFVKRFALGLEIDAVAVRSGLGLAVLPSLRCAL